MMEFRMIVHFLWVILKFYFSNACLPYGKSNRVQIGYPTYVCLTIGPFKWVTNSSFVRIASEMKADELGSINVKGCE